MDKEKLKNGLSSFLIWFTVFYLIFWGISAWQKKDQPDPQQNGNAQISLFDDSLVSGQMAQILVHNTTKETLTWHSVCDTPESLRVYGFLNNQKIQIETPTCRVADIPGIDIPTGKKAMITLPNINTALFYQPGQYQIELQLQDSSGAIETLITKSFDVEAPGMFRQLFRALVSKPLFNLLVFFIDRLPGHPLGWSIVLLTIVLRIALFFPNQKAMRSQRRLQKLQPKMDALRKKHGKNQQMMAMKTMELYKSHKINPMSSCLPMLAQMPFLIGLYLIIKDGLSPHLQYLLYQMQKGVDLSLVDTMFFRLDLEIPNIYVLPFLVAGAQFLAIKISMIRNQKKQSNKPENKPVKKDPKEGMMGQMEQMQKMMLYALPVMIGVFTATLPAAVGIYWLTSTVFGIGQQQLVNWQLDKPQVVRKKS